MTVKIGLFRKVTAVPLRITHLLISMILPLRKITNTNGPSRLTAKGYHGCPECDESFTTEVAMEDHISATHPGLEKKFKCRHCAKSFRKMT